MKKKLKIKKNMIYLRKNFQIEKSRPVLIKANKKSKNFGIKD